MKIADAYLMALQKSEQNLSNGGIRLDKARFIQLFNECQNKYVSYILEKKNKDDIRDIQKLVVSSKSLKRSGVIDTPQCYVFSLPDDFFSFIDISGRFSDGKCSSPIFDLHEVKGENVALLFADHNHKPSFKHRETFYTIGGDGVKIYVDDFQVQSAFLTYYRYPVQVDISGYIRSDGSDSVDVDPEFDDKVVNEILDMVDKQHALNESDFQRFQAGQANVSTPK